MTAICVAPDRIGEIWPHVRAFVEAAFAECRGDDDAELVHDDLAAGRALLWIAWDDAGKRIVAASTTKLLDVKRGKVCLITSCGGRGVGSNRWVHLISDIESYAKAEGCKYVRFEGRRGWQAIFPEYEQPWIVLEKRL